MGLNWRWEDKCGEIVLEQKCGAETKEYTLSLYEGNAFLIMIHEYKDPETGDSVYNLYSFFADKAHAKILLGLQKNSDGKLNNLFSGGTDTFKVLRICKSKNRHWKDIVTMFAQAFDEITIEIYKEEMEGEAT